MYAKPVFAMLLSLAALGFAAGAHGAPTATRPSDPFAPSVTVALADLDLTGTAGGRTALRRIHAAADQICGGAPQPADLARAGVYRDCMKDAVDHAVASLGSPVVAALNSGRDRPSHDQTAIR